MRLRRTIPTLAVVLLMTAIGAPAPGTAVADEGSDSLIFDANFSALGLDAYAAVIEPSRCTIVPDPVKPHREVLMVSTRLVDDDVLYPRVQLATPSVLQEGSDFYVGFGVYLPPDHESYDLPRNRVMLHEVYGPPFGPGGPNRLSIQGDEFLLTAGPDNFVWSEKFSKGTWTDFVIHYHLSRDADEGFVELWTNTGSGLEPQLLDDDFTFHYPTMVAGTNSGANYDTIKVAYPDSQTDYSEVTVLFAQHRVGTSLESVDPGSYRVLTRTRDEMNTIRTLAPSL